MKKILLVLILVLNLVLNTKSYSQKFDYSKLFIGEAPSTGGMSLFGNSIADAGDFNGDGFNDIVVGALFYGNNGSSFLFYGGTNADETIDLVFNFPQNYNNFGTSVSSAGDFNNDGFDDIIISANNIVFLYFGNNQNDGEPDLIFYSENNGVYFGATLASSGDINNDGFDDLIIGDRGYDISYGRAYIYYGNNILDNNVDLYLYSDNENANFGNSVSTAGDVNNDGFDDFLVGFSDGINNAGKVNLYFGSANPDNESDFSFSGVDMNNERMEFQVATAGDVNNDGYDDFLVGGNQPYSYFGIAYLFLGGVTINQEPLLTFNQYISDDEFAKSFASAGDINNDGFDDIIIGAEYTNNMFGATYIYYGGTNPDNIADFTINFDSQALFGNSVATCKDFNGDNISDLLIGAEDYNGYMGKCGVYFGSNNFDITEDLTFTISGTDANFGNSISGGDINNDGYIDIVIASLRYQNGRVWVYFGSANMDNKPDLILTTTNDGYYGFSVAANGDINNDGYNDIIVSGMNKNYIYYGSTNPDNIVDLTIPNTSDNSDIAVSYIVDFNGDGFDDFAIGDSQTNNIRIFFGSATPDNIVDLNLIGNTDAMFGCSVASAGDVNNDGYDDLIIGTLYEGKVYILFGSENPDNLIDLTFSSEYPFFGISVASAGDVNNDGYDDIIIGSPIENEQDGLAHLYLGGSVMDTTIDYTMSSNDENPGVYSLYGTNVGNIGDINADGFDDFVIGSYAYNDYYGIADIYFGSNDLNNITKFSILGKNREALGSSIFNLGDINNDSYSDFIIGAVYYPYNGAAYMFNGSNIIENIKSNDYNFEIYPNPSNGIININTDIDINNITVYDLTGKIVEHLNNFTTTIDLSNLKTGIYIIKFQSKNQNIKRKFIKL